MAVSKTIKIGEADLRFRLGTQAVWNPSSGQSVGPDNLPTRKFRKDIIKAGTYVKRRDGIVFEVTPAVLDHWVVQFSDMRANGVRVPLPFTHVDDAKEKAIRAGDPRDNAGWIDDMWVEPDSAGVATLWMSCQIYGDDGLNAVRRSDVSINSPKQYVDGKGHRYVQPITHVALVTDPVVPGLGEFIALSLSLRLAQEQQQMLDFLKQLAQALGLDPATIVDEETGTNLVMQALDALVKKAEAGSGATGEPTATSTPTSPSGTVKKEVVSREFAASQGGEDKPNPLLVKTIKENRELKLGQLVQAGKMSPAQRDKMAQRFCSDEAVGLALSSGSDGSDFDAAVEVFAMNAPSIKPGEKSGPQTRVALSNSGVQDDKPVKSGLLVDAERRAEQFNKQYGRTK